MNKESFNSAINWTGKAFPLAIGMAYVFGFIVVNSYLVSNNVYTIELISIDILAAGILSLALYSYIIIVPLWVIKTDKNNLWFIISAYIMYYMIVGIIVFEFYGSKVQFIGFIVLTIFISIFHYLFLYETIKNKKQINPLRILIQVYLILLLLFLFGSFIYDGIPRYVGGGQPLQGRFVLDNFVVDKYERLGVEFTEKNITIQYDIIHMSTNRTVIREGDNVFTINNDYIIGMFSKTTESMNDD